MISSFLRIASRVICLIVISSFVIFAVNQTNSASQGQQRELAGQSSQAEVPQPSHESALHEAIDEASEELTSPFSSFTAKATNEWVIRGTDTLLALLVYGFGLGFIARMLSIRT